MYCGCGQKLPLCHCSSLQIKLKTQNGEFNDFFLHSHLQMNTPSEYSYMWKRLDPISIISLKLNNCIFIFREIQRLFQPKISIQLPMHRHCEKQWKDLAPMKMLSLTSSPDDQTNKDKYVLYCDFVSISTLRQSINSNWKLNSFLHFIDHSTYVQNQFRKGFNRRHSLGNQWKLWEFISRFIDSDCRLLCERIARRHGWNWHRRRRSHRSAVHNVQLWNSHHKKCLRKTWVYFVSCLFYRRKKSFSFNSIVNHFYSIFRSFENIIKFM